MPDINTYVAIFETERFEYLGPIREDVNAGNKFYGEDVAQYLVGELNRHGCELGHLDEDWGWLILGDWTSGHETEIAIYNHGKGEFLGPAEGNGTNRWSLLIRVYERVKLLGVIPRKKQVVCPESLVACLRQALSVSGINLIRLEPGDDPYLGLE